MIKFLLDTNICVFYLRGKFNIDETLKYVGQKRCCISEVTIAELYYGAECSNEPSYNRQLIMNLIDNFNIIPITDCLVLFGKEKARLRKKGKLISDFDLLIGCSSVKHQMRMVTDNIDEFSRISNIELENWIIRNK